MEKALIISDSSKAMTFYNDFLKKNGYTDIKLAASDSDGRSIMADFEPDVCIINSPISGTSGEELSAEIAGKNVCQVILFIKEEFYDDMCMRMNRSGVICVVKPISRDMFTSALRFAEAAQSRVSMCGRNITALETKITDIKRADRAKGLLMKFKNMSEEEAHRYLEKTAMDRRVSRRQIADEIIDFYEED